MSVAPTDMLRGTGPLEFASPLSGVDTIEKKIDKLIQRLEDKERRSHGVGTRVLQGYEEDPFLLEERLLNEAEEQGELSGQLYLLWNPPIDTGGETKTLDRMRTVTAMAKRENVCLDSVGAATRVIGV